MAGRKGGFGMNLRSGGGDGGGGGMTLDSRFGNVQGGRKGREKGITINTGGRRAAMQSKGSSNRFASVMQKRGRAGGQQQQQQKQAQRNRGRGRRGRGRGRGGRGGGRGRGKGKKNVPATEESLDKDLDKYMGLDAKRLDSDLDEYRAQAASTGLATTTAPSTEENTN